MKNLILLLSLIGILFFSGCQNQPRPFNPNSKTIHFENGKAYHVPVGSNIKYLSKFNNKDIFELYEQSNCYKSIFWYRPGKLKLNYISSFGVVKNILTKKGKKRLAFPYYSSKTNETKRLSVISRTLEDYRKYLVSIDSDEIQIKEKEIKFINTYLSKYYPLGTTLDVTLAMLSNDKQLMDMIETGMVLSGIADLANKRIGKCIQPMSNKEYQYYSNKEKQNRQFQHEKNIQGQKSLDKSLDRLNNQLNQTNQQNYNNSINKPNKSYRITNQYGQTKGYLKPSNGMGL